MPRSGISSPPLSNKQKPFGSRCELAQVSGLFGSGQWGIWYRTVMLLAQVSFWRGDLRHQKYLEGRFAVQVSSIKSDLYQIPH